MYKCYRNKAWNIPTMAINKIPIVISPKWVLIKKFARFYSAVFNPTHFIQRARTPRFARYHYMNWHTHSFIWKYFTSRNIKCTHVFQALFTEGVQFRFFLLQHLHTLKQKQKHLALHIFSVRGQLTNSYSLYAVELLQLRIADKPTALIFYLRFV